MPQRQHGGVVGGMPEGIPILLAGDRFYGTAALICWCQEHGWQYRLRLKDTLILRYEGGEITTGEAAKAGIDRIAQCRVEQKRRENPYRHPA